MKRLILFVLAGLVLLAPRQVKANTDPPTWIDVQNYGADPTCVNDSGTPINNAIAAVSTSSAGAVIFFPTGCYLISHTILDNVVLCTASPCTASNGLGTPGISYLGFGRVKLQASSTLTGSIMQFGDDTHTIDRRRLSNLYLECSPPSGNQPNISGIVIDGLRNSEFDDVEIRDCPVAGWR